MSLSFKQHLFRLSLRFIILPFVVMLLISAVFAYTTAKLEAHRDNKTTLAILSLQINHYLQHPVEEIEQFKSLWESGKLLDDQKEANFFFYIDRIEVLDNKGYVTYTYPELSERHGFDASKTEAFKINQVDEPQLLGTVVDVLTGKPALSIAIRTQGGETLVAVLNLEGLRDFVKGVFSDIEQEVLITDNNGTIIADNAGDFVATRAAFPRYRLLVRDGRHVVEGFRFNNRVYTIYYEELLSNGWFLVVLNDEFKIYTQVMRQLSPYVLLALMIPLMLLGFKRTSEAFIKAFNRYYVITERIAGGDYDLPVAENSFNEFNLLHENFMRMVQGIRSREDEIHELNEELEELVATKDMDLQNAVHQLSEAQEQIFRAEKSRALQALVSGMTHELNTPLGIAITLNSHMQQLVEEHRKELIAGGCDVNQFSNYFEDTGDGFMLLSKNLDYLAQLIDSFKRIAMSQEQENIEVFSLKAYLEDILLIHKSELNKRRVEAEVVADGILLRTYPDLFGKLFSILIKNSLDHAFSAGGGSGETAGAGDRHMSDRAAHIWLTCTASPERLRLSYRDNGRGIPEALIANVFDPFVTSNRGGGNTGLGMSILQKIVVEQLKGQIHLVNGNPGVVFDMEIPITLYNEDLGIYQTAVKEPS